MRLKTTLLIVLVIGLLGGIAPGMALAQTDTDAPEATEGANDGLTEMIMARGASLFGVDPLQVGTRTIGVDATWFVGEAVVLRDETTWEGALFIAQRTGDTWNVLFEGDSGFEGARAALPVALADALNAEQASMVAQADVSAQATRTGAFAVRATEAAFVSTTSNFGNRHHLGLGNGGFGLLSMRSFIKFGNLNGSGRVPSGATPTRARLSLWQYSSPSCSLSQFIMQRATGGWSEGGINWGNQPGRAGNYGQQGWPCYSGPPVQRTWDFNSAIVTQMAAGNGMVLVNNPESGFGPLFCSDEPTNGQFCNSANFVPLLTVDWRLEGPGAPSISSPSQNQVLTALPMSVRVNGGSTNRGFSRYEIQISTTGNFSNVIYSSVVSSSGSSHSFNNINDPDLQTGTYYIRARVDDQGRDGIGALRSNWSSTRTFSLNLSADLSVVGTDNPDPVQTGDPITYEFTVANAGPGRVTAAELTVTLDENLTNVTASSDAGACSEPDAVTRVCAIGAINSGSSEIVTVSGTVAEVAITDLQVSAVASSELTDPNTANNDTTVDTTVTPVADMISSIDCPTAGNGVDAGSTVSCTVTATNQGTAAAAAAVLGIESTAGLQPVVSNA
ncbi:MAG: DNRLRE domain-containing protein, partial [Chloroflexota bacterium]